MRAALVNSFSSVVESLIVVEVNNIPSFPGYWVVPDESALAQIGYLFTPTDPQSPELGGTFSPMLPPLADLQAEAIVRVKQEAERRIFAIIPDFRQRNYTARALEIVNIHLVSGTITQAQQSEIDAINSVWQVVKSLRTHSDSLEAYVMSQTDPSVVMSFDPAYPPFGLEWPQ